MDPNTPTPDPNAKPRKVGATPERDLAQAASWLQMGTAWQANPQITLVDTTADEFAGAATAHNGKLQARYNIDDPRNKLGARLDTIRDLFAAALPYVKAALLPIFKKEGIEDAYPSFGIEHRDDSWQFPAERLAAQDAYDKATTGLQAQGLKAGEYGSEVLGPLAAEFRTKYAALVKLDGDISAAVGAKNLGKPYLKKTARCLRYVLKGNYPDTYDQVVRAWGGQREKF